MHSGQYQGKRKPIDGKILGKIKFAKWHGSISRFIKEDYFPVMLKILSGGNFKNFFVHNSKI